METNNRNNFLIALIIIAVAIAFLSPITEGYSSKTFRLEPQYNNYYKWRAYGHDVYDHDRLTKYPFNYQQEPHFARFNKFVPSFYDYGYGHL